MSRRFTLSLASFATIAGLVILAYQLTRPDQAKPVSNELIIYSTTDTNVFAPVIEDFKTLYPDIIVHYELLDALPLYSRILREEETGAPGADLILSSAMDLQVKLVNEGFAAPHTSQSAAALPSWASWRNEAFGVTFEPAVLVYNNELMEGRPLPQTRQELLRALRLEPEFWRGRVGTYDIAKSSVGYLLASQDDRRSNDFGMLLDAFGESHVVTSENTSSLLDQIELGKLAVGYNLLGSYARARVESGSRISIVYPQDYTLAVSRTAVILKSSRHPDAAHIFLEYLLSIRGQRVLSERSYLSAIRPEIDGPYDRLGISESQVGLLRPIALGPGLLVYLDPMKHDAILENWNEALHTLEAVSPP